MSQERLYQFAVLKHPTQAEQDRGVGSAIVVEPTHVLASSEQNALMRATLAIPPEEMKNADRLEVAVRPF